MGLLPDHFQNRFFPNRAIGKTQDLIAAPLEPTRTIRILLSFFVCTVMIAIELDDQSRGGAEKVHNVGANGLLSTEAQASKLLCP